MIALGICRRHTTVDSGTHSHRHTARERAQRAARTFICVRLVPPGAWPLYLLLSLTVNQTRETRVARDWNATRDMDEFMDSAKLWPVFITIR